MKSILNTNTCQIIVIEIENEARAVYLNPLCNTSPPYIDVMVKLNPWETMLYQLDRWGKIDWIDESRRWSSKELPHFYENLAIQMTEFEESMCTKFQKERSILKYECFFEKENLL